MPLPNSNSFLQPEAALDLSQVLLLQKAAGLGQNSGTQSHDKSDDIARPRAAILHRDLHLRAIASGFAPVADRPSRSDLETLKPCVTER